MVVKGSIYTPELRQGGSKQFSAQTVIKDTPLSLLRCKQLIQVPRVHDACNVSCADLQGPAMTQRTVLT